ncbi:MAG: hypothetical protein H6739_42165 [Alphaproteobacteria bacterium]|nr:hypothetical protein [Alphaproteobacteria bacterium]
MSDLDDLDYRPGLWRRYAPALLLAALAVGLGAWAWPYWTAYRAHPERWSDAVAAGVDLNHVVLFPDERVDYPYADSPLTRQLALEEELLGVDLDEVRVLADHIAEETAWWMLLTTGTSDVREAELALWRVGRHKEPYEHVARLLREAHIIYGEEELFARGFDPDANRGNFAHLDCDLLSHVFLHVGWRLDLDTREMNSPRHAYLSYGSPEGFVADPVYAEPTEFRSTFQRGDVIDRRGQELGDLFWITRTFHQKYAFSVQATAALTEAAGFYTEKTDRDLEDLILASVGVGVLEGIERGDYDAALRAPLVERLIAQAQGSRDPHLVDNVLWLMVREGRARLDEDPAAALAFADQAVALRGAKDAVMITATPVELDLRLEALHRLDDDDALEAQLARLDEVYTGLRSWRGLALPWDDVQARMLWVRARRAPRSLRTHNDLIVPLLNYLDNRAPRDEAWLAEVFELAAASISGTSAAQARAYRDQAAQLGG